jgi:elongator complex protein 4
MSFKRYAPPKPEPTSPGQKPVGDKLPPGVKQSSTPIISTGTSTLDALLSPSSGLPISSVLLVEEDGTGNYSGVVLRQYVAQGVIHGDKVWIGGVGEGWWRGVPGLAKQEQKTKSTDAVKEIEEKMKIAWRYGVNDPKQKNASSMPDTSFPDFCHTFNISEQMPFPGKAQVVFSPPPSDRGNPYQPILSSLLSFLEAMPRSAALRLVLPDFLNPLVYGPDSTSPTLLLRFLHTVIAIIHSRPYCTLILSLSTSFYPRTNPLTSWIEHFCTHVIQLCPLPKSPSPNLKQPQGLVIVHNGGLMLKEMAYRVGRRGMVLEEWSLPPLEEDAPRVKQGFVIDKDATSASGNVGTSLVSGVSPKDLEF